MAPERGRRLALGLAVHADDARTSTRWRTPRSVLSADAERSVGELNSERLRAYRRVDARWTRYFDTRRGRVSVFGEVYNLFDTHERPRDVEGAATSQGRGVLVVTGEFDQWPRLPLAGLTWEF